MSGSLRTIATLAQLFACVALAVLAAGCIPNIQASATRYATAEQATASALVPLADLPYRLCLRTAQYTYLWGLVQPRWDLLASSSKAPPAEPWAAWYARTPAIEDLNDAGRLVTWSRDCTEAEDLGQQTRKILRALRGHAQALAALADGSKAFDTSGLQQIASGSASLATTARAPASVGTAVSDAGSAVSSFTSKFVEWYRQGKLDEAIEASDDCMNRVSSDLRTMITNVQGELDILQRRRRAVVEILPKVPPIQAEGRALAGAFELAQDTAAEIDRVGASIPRYLAAVQRLSDSHHALAQQARRQLKEKDVTAMLAALNAALNDLTDNDWSR